MADPGSCTVTAMPFCYRLHRIMHDPRRRLRTFSLVRLLFATLTSRCYVRYVTNLLMVSGTAAVMKNPLKDRPIQRDVTAGYDVEDEATDAHAASSSMLNLPLPESFAPLSRRSLSSSCTMPPPAVVHRRVKTRCLDFRTQHSAGPLLGTNDCVVLPCRRNQVSQSSCLLCHIPYSRSLAPFSKCVDTTASIACLSWFLLFVCMNVLSMRMVRCGVCGNKWVPEMMIASIEPPAGLAMIGKGTFVQARVCRQRKKGTGDVSATIVSDALPFLEYELYRQVSDYVTFCGWEAQSDVSTALF